MDKQIIVQVPYPAYSNMCNSLLSSNTERLKYILLIEFYILLTITCTRHYLLPFSLPSSIYRKTVYSPIRCATKFQSMCRFQTRPSRTERQLSTGPKMHLGQMTMTRCPTTIRKCVCRLENRFGCRIN